jgi:hypothetical protein
MSEKLPIARAVGPLVRHSPPEVHMQNLRERAHGERVPCERIGYRRHRGAVEGAQARSDMDADCAPTLSDISDPRLTLACARCSRRSLQCEHQPVEVRADDRAD